MCMVNIIENTLESIYAPSSYRKGLYLNYEDTQGILCYPVPKVLAGEW